jgi:hypothetical protein
VLKARGVVETSDKGDQNFDRVIKYYQSAENFRGDLYNGTNDAPLDFSLPAVKRFAFDGDRYQRFSQADRTLKLFNSADRSMPLGFGNPLVIPYYWLFDQGEILTWPAVRDPARWNVAFKHATGFSKDKPSGDCFSTFSQKNLQLNFRVRFSAAANYYPTTFTATRAKDGVVVYEVKVQEYHRVQNEGCVAIVPLSVLFTQTGNDGSFPMRHEYSIELSSLRVNQGVDEDIFTLPRSAASFIWDQDLGVNVRKGATSVNILARGEDSSNWLLVGNIVFVLLLVSLVIYRQLRANNQ